MERAREDVPRDLELAPVAPDALTTARRTCPVCKQVRVTQVCVRCGVDVATGDLVQPPGQPAEVPAWVRERATLARRDEGQDDPRWDRRSVLAAARQGAFGSLVVAWLVASLQVLPGATGALTAIGSGGSLPYAGGPLALPAQVVTLYVLAYTLVARTRGVVRGARPFDLEDLAGTMLRALAGLVFLAPALGHPLTGLAVAAALPLLLGALASERPVADLGPAALLRAARRSRGLARAHAWSLLCLGPALAAVHVTSPFALWRPILLVLGATLAGVAAGFARRSAELER